MSNGKIESNERLVAKKQIELINKFLKSKYKKVEWGDYTIDDQNTALFFFTAATEDTLKLTVDELKKPMAYICEKLEKKITKHHWGVEL